MRTNSVIGNASLIVDDNSITAMSVDTDSTVFLMDALGKMYSRPAQAVLREYLSNALDAHAVKGGKLPKIQVTLPDSPDIYQRGPFVLSIRDYGRGMNEEEFKNILSRYGASTKRDTNTQRGGFGLGAKAGFAVGNEFFMTSYQNGKGLKVRIFKDVKAQGYVEVQNRFPTSEPDGMLVEVSVPAANLHELEFENLTGEFPFLLGYNPDEIQILQDGVQKGFSSVYDDNFLELTVGDTTVGWVESPEKDEDPTEYYSEDYTTDNKTSKMYALIGNVLYAVNLSALLAVFSKTDREAESKLLALNFFTKTKVFNIPIGSVDLPASREELILSEKTVATLRSVIDNYGRALHTELQKELNGKVTSADAITFLSILSMNNFSAMDSLTWQGRNIKEELIQSESECIELGGPLSGKMVSPSVTLKWYPALFSYTKNGRFANSIFYVEGNIETRNEIYAFLTSEVIEYFLRTRNLTEASFVIGPSEDLCRDWFAPGQPFTVADVKEVVESLEREKQEALLAQERAERKKQQAKKNRSEKMFSTFLLHTNAGVKVSKNAAKIVFKDAEQDKYYLSEEEVNNLPYATKELEHGNLFPFVSTGIPNEFAIRKSQTSWRAEYAATVLKDFLKIFIKNNARIILLGADRDLAAFKESYPSVPSVIELLKEKIAEQINQPASPVMLNYNFMVKKEESKAKGIYFHTKSQLLSRCAELVEVLSEEEVGLVGDDIRMAVEMFNSSVGYSYWNVMDAANFVQCIANFSSEKLVVNSNPTDSLERKISKDYPMFAAGRFNYYEGTVKETVMNYIKQCNSVLAESS